MSIPDGDLLILSSVEWDAVWQRHHAFAARWAATGRRVFFVENTGFRTPGLRDGRRLLRRAASMLAPRAARRLNPLPPGVTVVSPAVMPPTGRAFRALNEASLLPALARRLRVLGLGPRPLAVCYLPTATTLSLLELLRPGFVLYDCVDRFSGHPTPPADLAATEAALLARADLVTTTSRGLYDELKHRHSKVLELHHGVSDPFFLPNQPANLASACYFGTVWSALDYAALAALADGGTRVTLVGPRREPPPPLPATVTFRDAVAHAELPALLAEHGVLLLPYADTPYNRGVAPAKLYECLATGRPVLSSPLPSLADFGELLDFCRTPADWAAAPGKLAALEKDGARRAARVAAARAHSEESAFARLTAAIADAAAR